MQKSREISGHHSGIVAIAGRPNVGKSTLLNALLGQKISIVSRKQQTTRQKVLGILTAPAFQIVFVDTPGVTCPRDHLQERMVQSSFGAVSGADLAVVIVEATAPDHPDDLSLCRQLAGCGVPLILAVNKIDLVPKPALLPLIEKEAATGAYQAIVPVSALKKDGLPGLLDEVLAFLPEGPPLYAEDQIAVQPMRFFAAELIRETLFELLQDELPYCSAVKVDQYKERPGKKTFISAVIYAERESQKGIIIGRKGEMLKRIGAAARAKIENMVGEGIYLELWVKVKEKWRKNETFLKMVGYTSEG